MVIWNWVGYVLPCGRRTQGSARAHLCGWIGAPQGALGSCINASITRRAIAARDFTKKTSTSPLTCTTAAAAATAAAIGADRTALASAAAEGALFEAAGHAAEEEGGGGGEQGQGPGAAAADGCGGGCESRVLQRRATGPPVSCRVCVGGSIRPGQMCLQRHTYRMGASRAAIAPILCAGRQRPGRHGLKIERVRPNQSGRQQQQRWSLRWRACVFMDGVGTAALVSIINWPGLCMHTGARCR